MVKTVSEHQNSSVILDIIYIPTDDFVDEFRREWESLIKPELFYNKE